MKKIGFTFLLTKFYSDLFRNLVKVVVTQIKMGKEKKKVCICLINCDII